MYVNDEDLENLGHYKDDATKQIMQLKEQMKDADAAGKAEIEQKIAKLRKDRKVFIEGTAVKGENKILLNVNSSRALEVIMGHEVAHYTEKSDHYKKLNRFLREYAGAEYQKRFDSKKKFYSEEQIDQEVTADLVGEYIFTNEDFIMNLSVKEPNVFQRIFDSIKHAYKLATAGSAEARKLEKAKRMFEKAYREIVKNAQSHTENKVSFALEDIENMTEKVYNNHGWAKVNDVLNNREMADFLSKVGDKKRQNNHWYHKLSSGRYMFAVGEDGVNSTLVISNGNFENPSIEKVYLIGLDNETDIEDLRDVIYAREKSGRALASTITENYFADEPVELYRPEDFFGYKELREEYEREKGERTSRYNKNVQERGGSNLQTEYSITEKAPNQGAFFNTTSDSQGKELTENQQYRYRNVSPLLKDENGRLKRYYHGTSRGDRVGTIFDPERATSGPMAYFTAI